LHHPCSNRKAFECKSNSEAGRIARATPILESAAARFKPKSRGVPEGLQPPPRPHNPPRFLLVSNREWLAKAASYSLCCLTLPRCVLDLACRGARSATVLDCIARGVPHSFAAFANEWEVIQYLTSPLAQDRKTVAEWRSLMVRIKHPLNQKKVEWGTRQVVEMKSKMQ
jgi:hypothetical protein